MIAFPRAEALRDGSNHAAKVQTVMKPEIGLVFTHPTLGNVRIIAIHPLGTIDVQNIFTDRCYRISGLPLTKGAA